MVGFVTAPHTTAPDAGAIGAETPQAPMIGIRQLGAELARRPPRPGDSQPRAEQCGVQRNRWGHSPEMPSRIR